MRVLLINVFTDQLNGDRSMCHLLGVALRPVASTHLLESSIIDTELKYHTNRKSFIIESVDSISRDERGFPLTQYITNGHIFRARYTITHFKHHHRVLRLISNRMSV